MGQGSGGDGGGTIRGVRRRAGAVFGGGEGRGGGEELPAHRETGGDLQK